MTSLRQWLAAPYDGPGRRRAALTLWLRDLADGLADGPPGLMRWRWRASVLIQRLRPWSR